MITSEHIINLNDFLNLYKIHDLSCIILYQKNENWDVLCLYSKFNKEQFELNNLFNNVEIENFKILISGALLNINKYKFKTIGLLNNNNIRFKVLMSNIENNSNIIIRKL